MIDVDDNRPRTGRRWRSRWLWLAVPAGIVLVGGAIAVALLYDPAEPVSVDDAVTRYRDGGTTDPDGAPATGDPPPPGLYVYATTGSEGVDVLGGSTHPYPAESTITVTAADDDCLIFRWAPLEQRWNEEVLCPDDDGGWSLVGTTLHHSFFNQGETRTNTCDGPGFVPVPDADGDLTWTCESEGSGRSGETVAAGTGRIVGTDTVTVAGVDRPALHVRYEDEVTGETSGTGTLDRWYAFDRFPLLLREVSSATSASETVIGRVNYHEDYELVLASWEPQR